LQQVHFRSIIQANQQIGLDWARAQSRREYPEVHTNTTTFRVVKEHAALAR
jgi:hypothetical protein